MLTIAAVKAAGAQSRAQKLFDGGGLFLFVTPAGTKSWRLKYRIKGREKLLVLGRFPAMSLQEARAAREDAKEQLRRGVDPGAEAPVALSFEQLARGWHAHEAAQWSTAHADEVLASLEREVFPAIGARAPSVISSMDCLAILQALEARGRVASARRLRHRLSAIFRYGRPRGIAQDPASKDALLVSLRRLPIARPMPALTDIGECRALLRACDHLAGAGKTIILASRFLALTAVRLAAVRGARWNEVDLAARTWTVPAARMKLGRAKKGDGRFDHVVPLSEAAIAVLEAVRELGVDDKLIGGQPPNDRLIFPGRGGNSPIGEGAIGDLYARAGFAGHHVPHGWRASFSTILNEELGREWRDDIDEALAHSTKGAVEGAYNRAQLLERRRAVFDRWGELLAIP